MGADVSITPNADSSKTFKGKVLNIGNCAVKNDSGNNVVNVEISISDQDKNSEFLQEGYTTSLKINKK